MNVGREPRCDAQVVFDNAAQFGRVLRSNFPAPKLGGGRGSRWPSSMSLMGNRQTALN